MIPVVSNGTPFFCSICETWARAYHCMTKLPKPDKNLPKDAMFHRFVTLEKAENN
jgi:hypothetical protein